MAVRPGSPVRRTRTLVKVGGSHHHDARGCGSGRQEGRRNRQLGDIPTVDGEDSIIHDTIISVCAGSDGPVLKKYLPPASVSSATLEIGDIMAIDCRFAIGTIASVTLLAADPITIGIPIEANSFMMSTPFWGCAKSSLGTK